jgi:hypothetical protein
MTIQSKERKMPITPIGELQNRLQDAIKFEFSTIPAYLYMIWSINIDTNSAGEARLKEVQDIEGQLVDIVKDEMLHMSLCCNMLKAIGGNPDVIGAAPKYPHGFSGGIHAGVEAKLLHYSKAALEQFLLVEYPKKGPFEKTYDGEPAARPLTVGAFYDEIWQGFLNVNPPISNIDAQHELFGVGGEENENLTIVTTIGSRHGQAINGEVKFAIFEQITRQGEGSGQEPREYSSGGGDQSHYYGLAELHRGHRLVEVWHYPPTYSYTGAAVEILATEVYKAAEPVAWHNVARPISPATRVGVKQNIAQQMDEFNTIYSEMIRSLNNAWNGGNKKDLYMALGTMVGELEKRAKALMQEPISDDPAGRTYGPEFFYVP